jgi:hypothetical protein
VGLLQACVAYGRLDFRRCVVFHSLSKRSNAPGLRWGFVACDADIMHQFLLDLIMVVPCQRPYKLRVLLGKMKTMLPIVPYTVDIKHQNHKIIKKSAILTDNNCL